MYGEDNPEGVPMGRCKGKAILGLIIEGGVWPGAATFFQRKIFGKMQKMQKMQKHFEKSCKKTAKIDIFLHFLHFWKSPKGKKGKQKSILAVFL